MWCSIATAKILTSFHYSKLCTKWTHFVDFTRCKFEPFHKSYIPLVHHTWCMSYSFSWHSGLEAQFTWLTFWGLGNTRCKATEPHGSQRVRTQTGPVAWLKSSCVHLWSWRYHLTPDTHYCFIIWQMSVCSTAVTGSLSPASLRGHYQRRLCLSPCLLTLRLFFLWI